MVKIEPYDKDQHGHADDCDYVIITDNWEPTADYNTIYELLEFWKGGLYSDANRLTVGNEVYYYCCHA
jgi:hypothetical protein